MCADCIIFYEHLKVTPFIRCKLSMIEKQQKSELGLQISGRMFAQQVQWPKFDFSIKK